MSGETVNNLLDVAENAIRLKGYHAVSFRDLADELGIKSASVHYHFRQKEDLGVAVVERYSCCFFDALNAEAAESTGTSERLRSYCSAYRKALIASDRICLCAMLGAESNGLPPRVAKAVSSFLKANLEWLAEAFATRPAGCTLSPEHVLATLQGAMMLAGSLQDHAILDRAVDSLLAHVSS